MQIESIAVTNVGLVRSMNQDAIFEMPAKGLFLVADGMGGEKAGEEASAQVVETIKEKFGKFFEGEPTGPSQIEGEMRDGLLGANRDVFQISVREPDKRGLGSTASLLCLHRGVYFAAQVGDSRIYLMRDHHVQQITRDHTLVWALYEQGAITREQLETHPDRHLLTQCIGNERPVKVDTFMGQIVEGDTFLICSDGLTGYAKEPKVFEILRMEEIPLEQRAKMLVQAALDAGGGDNVSVILSKVVKLESGDDWEPEATAPPAKFSDEDTEHAFATSVHRIDDVFEQKKDKTKGMLGWVGVLLGVIGLIGIFVYLAGAGSAQRIRVNLSTAEGSPPSLRVLVSQDGGEWRSQAVQSDETGNYVDLDGPGVYRLQFEADGYESPNAVAVEVGARDQLITLKPLTWVKSGRLLIELPEGLPVASIEVINDSDKQAATRKFDKEAIAAAGRQLAVSVTPNTIFTVRAVGNGGEHYMSDMLRVAPGHDRRVPIYFKEQTPQP